MMSKKATIKKVDESSWLVIDQQRGNVGVLYQNIQGTYGYLSNEIKEEFVSNREVEKFFGAKVFKNHVDDVVQPDKMFIAGFEIPFPAPELVSTDHPEYNSSIPLFSKTANSDVLYAAGWYAINFEKGWKHGYCPKATTLFQYGYEGPFNTKDELRFRLKELNKIKRNEIKNAH
jgi:hypothetical protein